MVRTAETRIIEYDLYMIKSFPIPEYVLNIGAHLVDRGFDAYLVGGCVRDVLLGRGVNDWDIATNAKPEQIQELFPDSVYENQFGTVGIKERMANGESQIVEVTTYRLEGAYTDKRHPDTIKFANTLEEDLARRDFTINAMAVKLPMTNDQLPMTDLFGGQEDLKKKLIRCVGNPDERFGEDALRLMRAVRFATQLECAIEKDTADAMARAAASLDAIAQERIRDEFVKIVMSEHAATGMVLLEQYGLLQYIIPELREGIAIAQNRHHIFGVWEHSVRTLDYAAQQDYSLEVRLASLFHDIAKPRTKAGEGEFATFYNHERVGARMARAIMERMRFDAKTTERVEHLVKYHMFYYNTGEVSEAGVRRFINRVGIEYLDDLIRVREADRIGSGVPKAVPYKIRHLLYMIEKVRHDPVSSKMLAVNGDDVMHLLGIEPGPRVGSVLAILLDEVLEDPKRNSVEYLAARIRELGSLSDEKLRAAAQQSKTRALEFEQGVDEQMKRKHAVS